MGKAVKTKKHDTFIDMTAMSDVTVLLLTFFMLTATFLPNDPFKVEQPRSVSDAKIPEANVLTVLIDQEGKIFLNFDGNSDANKMEVFDLVAQDYSMTFTDQQKRIFLEETHIGVPMGSMAAYLDLPETNRKEEIVKFGVPADSVNNQFNVWIKHAAKVGGENFQIAIKADASTPYPLVESVMKNLVKVKENRFNFLTSLRATPNID